MSRPCLASRRPRTQFTPATLLVLTLMAVSPLAAADDWLAWGGPNGDFTVDVEGLAEAWPENGPPRLWERDLGPGYPSILVKDEKLYTIVHFVYRGDAPAVGVNGNFLPLSQTDQLYHVAGTDLYFRSYRLAPASHYEYSFDVFEDYRPDPLNPRRLVDDDDHAPSVVTTRGWQEPAFLREPDPPGGTLEQLPWSSTILENERELSVWLPPGYHETDRRYPLVIVNYGNQALQAGRWQTALDNLVGTSVAPLIAVFVPRISFAEYGPRVVQLADAVESELIPLIEQRYRTLPGAKNRLITGIASGGFASVYLALRRPQLIANVAVQSFYFRDEAKEEMRSLIAKGDSTEVRFLVEWSSFDLKADGLDCQGDSSELAELLAEKGYPLVTSEVSDGAGWGSWRARTGRILETFFPAE